MEKALTLEELLKLVATGKATATQKIQLSELLKTSTEQELKQEKSKKIEKIFDLMNELDLTREDVFKAFQEPSVLIYEWQGNKRFSGERGKLPQWTQDLKAQLSKEKALEFVVNKHEKGFKFIENLYKIK